MKKLAAGIYFENSYKGVQLGAIEYNRGVLIIDTPPVPEEGRAWFSELQELNFGPENFLLNLDAHPDRILGNHLMKATIIAQNEVAESVRQRPSIFKSPNSETGAEWETLSGLTGIRLLSPEITFSSQIVLRGKDFNIYIEHHPGPNLGASWVIVPEKKIIFIGDAVLVKQPPFFANADFTAWVDSLDLLLANYKSYRIISSRGGTVNEKQIRSMRKLLLDVNKKLERLGKKKASPEETRKLVAKILLGSESPAKYKARYSKRLEHGLYQNYIRNFYPGKVKE